MIYLEKPIECLFTTGSQIDFTDLQRTRTTVCNSRVSSIIRDFNSKLIQADEVLHDRIVYFKTKLS